MVRRRIYRALPLADRRGFIPVSDLARLPALDAPICVTLRRSPPPLPVPHWKLVPQRVVADRLSKRDTPARCSVRCWIASLPLSVLTSLARWKAIGGVSLKANEPGLRQLAHRCRVPLNLQRRESCSEHEQRFPASSLSGRRSASAASPGPVARC